MVSLRVSAVLLALASISVSQSIDPSTVPIGTRQVWCNSQITQCPLICLQQPTVTSLATDSNSCDTTTLAYSCVCQNGISPNASEYSLTIPYYICTQANTNCVANCGGNSACQSSCREDHPCGASDPTRVNTSTITTMSSTATTNAATQTDAVCSGFGECEAATTTAEGGSSETSAGDSSSSSSAATRLMLDSSEKFGLIVVAAGIFAGFSILL